MLNNVGTRCLIQIAQLLLSKSNSFVFKLNLNASITILALVYNNWIVLFFHYMTFVKLNLQQIPNSHFFYHSLYVGCSSLVTLW
jgi:hypothetical protein